MPKKNKNEKYFKKRAKKKCIPLFMLSQRGSGVLRPAGGVWARQRDCVLYMQYIKLCILYTYIGVHFFIYTARCCLLFMCIHIGVHFLKILPAFIVSG
nr:MAG TPA: hypothetical protein [Caudoviricetes sp.]